MRKETKPILTFALIAINVIVFMALTLVGGRNFGESMIKYGGGTAPLVFDQGEWYRLFTSMFLHFDWEHLFGNMVALFAIGIYAESYFGKIRYATIYFMSGLVGGLFSLLVDQRMNQIAVHAGASGAVFGVMACIIIFAIDRQTRPYFPFSRVIIGIPLLILPGLMNSQIDFVAHIAGFLTGFLISYTFYYFINNKRPVSKR